MIPSLSSSERTSRPDAAAGSNSSPTRPPAFGADRISTEGFAHLEAALDREPALRPAVLERARALLADPGYPSPAIIKRVAEQIVRAPDLSDDES